MLTVACVWVGEKFGREYPEKLRSMVSRHLSLPHRFVCITEHEWDGERLEPDPLLTDPALPGWWQKISLFKPGRFDGRVLYLDLDVVILSRMEPLIERRGNWIMRDPFAQSYNSSVMLWEAGTQDHVYTCFRRSVMERSPEDQAWITLISDWEMYAEADVCSYKGCGGQRKGIVSVFHGHPKPHDYPCEWVRQEWC